MFQLSGFYFRVLHAVHRVSVVSLAFLILKGFYPVPWQFEGAIK